MANIELAVIDRATGRELSLCEITSMYLTLEKKFRALENFVPTPENINALPEGLRKHIADIDTVADPAGMTGELELTRMQNAALGLKVLELSKQLEVGGAGAGAVMAGVKGACARYAGFNKNVPHGYVGDNERAWFAGWHWADGCIRDENFVPKPEHRL